MEARRIAGRTAKLASRLALIASLALLVALGVGPRTGRYQTVTMLTDSMSPSMPAGSVVVVTREPVSTVEPGQVITFAAPISGNPIVTHRILSVKREGAA